MPKHPYTGPEKRTYTRIVYQAGQRPRLVFKNHQFEVTDISERGLKFIHRPGVRLGRRIEARVVFADGKSFSFQGRVIRKKDREVGIYFKDLMPYNLLLGQQQSALNISG